MMMSDDKVGGSKKVKIMMTQYLNGPEERKKKKGKIKDKNKTREILNKVADLSRLF